MCSLRLLERHLEMQTVHHILLMPMMEGYPLICGRYHLIMLSWMRVHSLDVEILVKFTKVI